MPSDFTGAIQPLLAALPDVLAGMVQYWWSTADGGIGKLLFAGFGVVVEFLWRLAGGLFGGANIFTQLPPDWTYRLAPVTQMQERLRLLAGVLVGLGITLSVLWAGVGAMAGIPFGRLLNSVPRVLLASAGLVVAPTVLAWWIDFANATSGALLDPSRGLPGLSEIRGYDRASAVGVVAAVYVGFALVFLLSRLKLVVLTALLLTVAPLAIATAALPFPMAHRFFRWWLTAFITATLVQVLQAVCLSVAAGLVSSTVVTGRYDGGGQGAMAVALGIGALAVAMALPKMLQAGVAAGGTAGWAQAQRLMQARRTVAQATSIPVVGQVAVPRHASIRELPQANPAYVRSLLGEGVPATARV